VVRFDDLIITLAYFSIPLQIVIALLNYPRLQSMSWKILLLTVLFALFIFLCGTGHLFRCMGYTHGLAFDALNITTAAISLLTAIYLMPLIPHLFASLDKTLVSEIQAKRKVLTFMSFLCHEIRNPLFAITSTITFMSDDNALSAEQRVSLDCIEQSANLMLRLVNDVLDISKLESGKLQLEQKTFDLVKMLGGAATSIETDIRQKHKGAVSFELQMGALVPYTAIGDSVRILQIAYNLLSNSAKFTEEGFVKFRVDVVPILNAVKNGYVQETVTRELMKKGQQESATDCGDTIPCSDGSIRQQQDFSLSLLQAEEGQTDESCCFNTVVLKLEVEDSGVGVSPERQQHIFQPYSQAKLSDYRKHGGTGLGLSIVTRLVEIMGGSIHMESQLHEGSTFTVYIPLKVEICPSADTLPTLPIKTKRNSAPAPVSEVLSSAAKDGDRDDPEIMQQNALAVALPGMYGNNNNFLSPVCAKPLMLPSPTSPGIPSPPLTAPSTPLSQSGRSTSPNGFSFDRNECVVLVVDDNAINRKLLARMLKYFKLEHFDAQNGLEAVEFMKKSRNFTHDPEAPNVGLILMDWSMPVMDGYEATKTIREMNMDVPIVALTACALEEGLQKLTKAGSNEIATKPILRDQLYLLCQRYLVEWGET